MKIHYCYFKYFFFSGSELSLNCLKTAVLIKFRTEESFPMANMEAIEQTLSCDISMDC